MMAMGVINALRLVDLHVPGDVSVIGFDNIGLSAMVMPALTTVAQLVTELAQASVRLLLQQIADDTS